MKKLLTVIWFILAVLTMPVAMTAQGQSSGGGAYKCYCIK